MLFKLLYTLRNEFMLIIKDNTVSHLVSGWWSRPILWFCFGKSVFIILIIFAAKPQKSLLRLY